MAVRASGTPGVRSSGHPRMTLATIVLLAFTLITLDERGIGPIDDTRRIAMDAIAPVTDRVHDGLQPIKDTVTAIREYDDAQREIERITAELEVLRANELQATGLRVQNETYEAMLDLDTGNVDAVFAQVRNRSASNIDGTIEIDRGATADIRIGDPVIAASGALVGQIVDVSDTRARVRLVTDPELSLGVRLIGPSEEVIDQGLATGDGNRGIDVTFLAPDSQLQNGDLATTGSSFDEAALFPPDLLVGVVRSTSVDEGGVNQTVKLVPIVPIDQLDVVAVLRYRGR
jgi:rod shape-determining protein MreC